MNAHGLPRQRMLHNPGHRADQQQAQQDMNFEQYPRKISATAETGDPTRSFKMLFQYEEAARYRSQELRDQAEHQRLLREASRLRKESGRRARRTLAGLFLN